MMHILKPFEEYDSGAEPKVGIVSSQTIQLLADVSKLLSPIHFKYLQICLYDEWEHFKMEKDIDCSNIMKDFHARNYDMDWLIITKKNTIAISESVKVRSNDRCFYIILGRRSQKSWFQSDMTESLIWRTHWELFRLSRFTEVDAILLQQ